MPQYKTPMNSRDEITRYLFKGQTGYIISPETSSSENNLIALRHTGSVTPWSDLNVHKHRKSEEFYILIEGQLKIQVRDFLISLQSNEILMIKPKIPHAIVGGTGDIEHFGIRTPAIEDKLVEGEINQNARMMYEEKRLVSDDWGHRMPLNIPEHQNCWLIGAGIAKFKSEHMIMAYLDFPTDEAANAGVGTRHRMHLHERSWEYYLALQGCKTLQVEDRLVTIEAGEILKVPPQVRHTLHSRQAPYQGFTIRVPVELNDKINF